MIGFNLNKVKRHFLEVLGEVFSQREAEQLMRILLEDLFGIDRKTELMNPSLRITEEWEAILSKAVNELLIGKPVQYVTGKAWFDGLLFEVDETVLIPRPETEEMVQMMAVELPVDKPFRIWDIGTGSGCIAIALAHRFSKAEVIAIDVSECALKTASRNVFNNKVDVQLVCDDVLHPQSKLWQQPVDLVVSNPPYVRESEKENMECNVLDHEPAGALFVPDDDPLLYYRKILSLAKPQLHPGGVVWFEINEALGEEILLLARDMGFTALIKEDFFGKPRYLKAFLETNPMFVNKLTT